MSPNNSNELILPCLRGKIGDWFYYVTIMQFKEIANRVSMVPEIHKSKELSRWIQREVTGRSKDIVEYLNTQEQRFFNSLILGLYGGNPSYSELNILDSQFIEMSEETTNYLSNTFGILSLNGDEKIFAIDGQHRTKAIQDALLENVDLAEEEIAVVFVAHKNTPQGEVRTRRLFSTLNRYAKPVSKSEIIALDEEDNCAIITRRIIDEWDFMKDKIMFRLNKSIDVNNKDRFTNIRTLYDIVCTLLTNKTFYNVKTVKGENAEKYTMRRISDSELLKAQEKVQNTLTDIIQTIPCLKAFFDGEKIDRKQVNSSLLFRPIGQTIFFSAYKIAQDTDNEDKVLAYFKTNTFNLEHPIWKKLFYDSDTETIKSTPFNERFALKLILKKIGIDISFTSKENEMFTSYHIDLTQI